MSFASREVVREWLERRWRAGIGLKRILIAGAGELGRLVADKILEHRELGYQIVGFVDDRAGGDVLGHRGLPLLGTLDEAGEIAEREGVDHLYVALPAEEHARMLRMLEAIGQECVDVKVVPDLLQVIALKARLEDLDGIPIININDVPLQGFNSALKRSIDIGLSALALMVLAIPFAITALIIRLHVVGAGVLPAGADGPRWQAVPDLQVPLDVHRCGTRDRPGVRLARRPARARRSAACCGGRTSTSCRSSGTCSAATCRSSGRGRSARSSSSQFKQRIPQYMLRHKVRAGLTGWAQVNGWRGNTSIEKRIEYDLYYIENWSVALDLKIMWLTLLKGFFHRHAY